MDSDQQNSMYTVEQALQAQRALRAAAGAEEELFPIQAFVGMISDEIQMLREQGKTDEEIAGLIQSSSEIKITSADLRSYYATPEQRRRGE